jgi:putative DNA primase/helicase
MGEDGRFAARAMTGEDRVLDGAALPFDYDAGAECPRWLDFLSNPDTGVWGDQPDCADRVRLLREWLGATLIGEATHYQGAVLLSGEGSNGKSVVLSTILALFPASRRLALEWHDLEGSEKGNTIAALRGVRLAYDDDMSTGRPLEATGTLKKLIVGSPLRGRALYASGIEVHPRAGWLAACNGLPTTRDTSEGFFRRILVLTFNRKYAVPDNDGHVEPGAIVADETLGEVLAQELPGILRWALGGVADLRRRGGYDKPPSVRAAREEHQANNDAIGAYLAQVIDPELPVKWVAFRELYDDFRDWCKDNGFDRPPSSMGFAKRLVHAPGVHSHRKPHSAGYDLAHNRIGCP